MNEHVTLMRPERSSTAPGLSSGFPADLLNQSAARLRVLALLYGFVFFMGGVFPALLFPGDRVRFLGSFVQWGPSVIGIVVALLIAGVIRSPRLSLPAAMNVGLAFEIASSYAIAAAEFADPMGLEWKIASDSSSCGSALCALRTIFSRMATSWHSAHSSRRS